ncbi:hypothetical protein FGO68_gene8953 [Halteria grandinella]|uniref:C2H2-type domain-containing protein n=1 Tax=Halteria grandinella TaxID=5974 RepID=A0A8J8NX31_HALGN|nr:hypothetical protein FGO68_gene8953 [Halteria grandinella]
MKKKFLFVKFLKPKARRWSQCFVCQHKKGKCNAIFKKWHNIFDHIRSHTKEKPFRCRAPGCLLAFSQHSNLIKHQKIHHLQSEQKARFIQHEVQVQHQDQ